MPERIPNNVGLADNKVAAAGAGAIGSRASSTGEEMGPSDFNAAERLSAHGDQRRSSGLATYGSLKMPDYRWEFSSPTRRRIARSASATCAAKRRGKQVPGEHRRSCAG